MGSRKMATVLSATDEKKALVRRVIMRLEKLYPDARTALEFSNPLELMVAVILSAQCTDAMVNRITPTLFRRYGTARDYAGAEAGELEDYIKSCGFYHSKAKNIIGAAQKLVADFEGEIPRTMAEIITLPGIARKSGNIILYATYGVAEGIAVDTHVKRLSQRLGLSAHTDPDKIERDLMDIVPQVKWGRLNYLLVNLGRDMCTARIARHDECVLRDICSFTTMDV